ncbi:hypothetical protein Hdeb2414_s0002g00067821 [Helianthus debilis subsp. tardiflorus]
MWDWIRFSNLQTTGTTIRFFKVKEKQKEEAGNAYRSGPLKKQSAGES